MLHVSKARAGSSSLGFTWDADGAVVEVPDEVAAELVAIPDGGFTIVSAPDGESEVAPADPQAVTEPAPDDDQITESPAKPTRKTAAKKTAAPDVTEA